MESDIVLSTFTTDYVNPCWSSPCQNNGSCVLTPEGYMCLCSFDFSGERCEYTWSKYLEHSGNNSCQPRMFDVQAERYDGCGHGVCVRAARVVRVLIYLSVPDVCPQETAASRGHVKMAEPASQTTKRITCARAPRDSRARTVRKVSGQKLIKRGSFVKAFPHSI